MDERGAGEGCRDDIVSPQQLPMAMAGTHGGRDIIKRRSRLRRRVFRAGGARAHACPKLATIASTTVASHADNIVTGGTE